MARRKKTELIEKPTVEQRIQKTREEFGQDAIYSFQDHTNLGKELISTGSIYQDSIIDGGYLKGSVAEIAAWSGIGKTSAALHVCKDALKRYPDEICIYLDAEHRLNEDYAEKIIGKENWKRVLRIKKRNGEEALKILEKNLCMGGVAAAVVDSIPAIIPKKKLEDKARMAALAGLMGEEIPKFTSLVEETETLLLLINQFRVTNMSGFGNPIGHAGGNTIPYYASYQLEYKIKEKITNNESIIGQVVNVKTIKNSWGKPHRECYFYLWYGEGIKIEEELVEIGVLAEIIERSGTWYSLNGHKVQGRLQAIDILKKDKDLFKEIYTKCRKFYLTGEIDG